MRNYAALTAITALAACAGAPTKTGPVDDQKDPGPAIIWLDTRFEPTVSEMNPESDVAVIQPSYEHVLGARQVFNAQGSKRLMPSKDDESIDVQDGQQARQAPAQKVSSASNAQALSDRVYAAWLRECEGGPLSDEEFDIVHATHQPEALRTQYGDCLNVK